MKTLIEATIEKQGRTTDEEFAKLLGQHRVTWTNKRNLKRPLSPADKIKIIQIFPDLMPIFLSENSTSCSKQ